MIIYIIYIYFINAIPNVKLLNLVQNHNKKICADNIVFSKFK